jgi:exodeoxyribonuclease-3
VRIATHNVNGIRAALRRGYPEWVRARQPDVICLQEVRAPEGLVPDEAIDGYHFAYHAGERAGRNGVAVLTRAEPSEVRAGFGSAEFDPQGRYVEVDLPGVTVASLYLPKGDVYGPKFESKMRFMAEFSAYIVAAAARAAACGREYVVCGDFNLAHTENDIKAWKANLKSDGFLPEERAWYGEQIDPKAGAVLDVLRGLYPDQAGPYTWWSWRGKAFDNDAGWRIDHHWATPGLAAAAHTGSVDRAPSYAERISDHAPVTIDYDIDDDRDGPSGS